MIFIHQWKAYLIIFGYWKDLSIGEICSLTLYVGCCCSAIGGRLGGGGGMQEIAYSPSLLLRKQATAADVDDLGKPAAAKLNRTDGRTDETPMGPPACCSLAPKGGTFA